MQIKRPANLFLRKLRRPEFDLADLVSGGPGVVVREQWQALAPHLGTEVDLEFEDLAVLDALHGAEPQPMTELALRFGSERLERLVESGLLLGDHAEHEALRARSAALESVGWWPVAALAQVFGRWQAVDDSLDRDSHGRQSLADKMAVDGPPPPEAAQLRARETWLELPAPVMTGLDQLLAGRTTCRNFDPDLFLTLGELAKQLHRVFGAQAQQLLAPQAVALKKNSPSGGGLHPIEAYLLVQRVEGLAPGLYHYHSTAHVLEPMQDVAAEQVGLLARELVAGQAWFANAPVLVLMAARFDRCYWKYRNHSKAWRVVQLDAGHLSQNFYLSATEGGFGAFVTGAINDDCAERLFELDGIASGAIAVCGFGRRASDNAMFELDPLGKAAR